MTHRGNLVKAFTHFSISISVCREETMNTTLRYSRRNLIQLGAGAGIALALGGGLTAPGARQAFAQNGDTELVANADGVRIRKNPGLSGTIIGSLSRGAVVNLIGEPVNRDGYTWLNISPQSNRNLTGWAAAQFFDRGGGTGWAAGTVVRVKDGPLNLRRSAGTSGAVIRTYATGTLATIISGPTSANGYAWYKVKISRDGNVGFFAGNFLEVARSEPTGDRLRVVNGPLRLRKNPGLSSAVLTTLANGAIVVIADASSVRQDGYLWRYVRVESNPSLIGWIADGFTERIG